MRSTADRAAGGTEYGKNRADNDENDPDSRQDGYAEYESGKD